MRLWKTLFLVGLGAILESLRVPFGKEGQNIPFWETILVAGLLGWSWSALSHSLQTIKSRWTSFVTGRPQPLPRTDPKALAEEVAALNAQIAALRDTATSFDVSFDETLHRMDERLRRVEQQSPYVQVRPGS